MTDSFDTIIATLSALRFNCDNEQQMQDGIEQALKDAGIWAEREYRLSVEDRIDFYVHHPRIGIEVKVKGSPSDVLRQCLRYANYKVIKGIVLVTSRLRLSLPDTLAGKPARTLSLWRQGF